MYMYIYTHKYIHIYIYTLPYEVDTSMASHPAEALPKLHGFRNLPAAAMVMSPSCAPGGLRMSQLHTCSCNMISYLEPT